MARVRQREMGTVRTQFAVGGMACSFCAGSIEKALGRTNGVEDVSVSPAHEEVLVEYREEAIGELELRDTLRELGYTIRDRNKTNRFAAQREELTIAKRRLVVSGIGAIVTVGLMVYMLGRYRMIEHSVIRYEMFTLAIALGTMFGPGRYIVTKAYHSVRRGILNQHVLLEAGAFAGLIGGVLGMTVVPSFPTVHFFAVSTLLTAYHVLGGYASLLVRVRASRAVETLLELQPDTARRVRDDGTLEEVPVGDLERGDRVRVKPGESVPVDGTILEGQSTVDESLATGESIPEVKRPGDDVIGGSLTETGSLLVEVTATGEDAFLQQVAREIDEARARTPSIVQLADRVLKYFVPGVLAIAVLSFLFWIIVPQTWGASPDVARGGFAALAVLVLGYPCALGMATPLALVRGGGKAANRGVLMRSGDAFQIVPEVEHVLLDKTGTITVGEPTVREVVPIAADEDSVLETGASAEAFSEHPLADAILDHADERDVSYTDPETFESVTGNGVRATVDGRELLVGKPDWLETNGVEHGPASDELERLQDRGLTISGVVRNGELIGLIGIGDTIKTDASETIHRMKNAGLTPGLLTGDNERTARAVADEVGIDRVMADVLPDEKRDEIERIQNADERSTGLQLLSGWSSDSGGRVAMVGDGINDAPALTQADVGIAIGAGTDIAIESADIVVLGDRLGGTMDAYEIGRESYRKTRQNLIAAFSVNGIGVAAATTGLVHPIWAMFAMVVSVTAVLANSFTGPLVSGEGVNTAFDLEDPERRYGTDEPTTE